MPDDACTDTVEVSSSLRDPGPPFDDPKADIIVRSKDGVDFRVYKLILSMASEVFSGMFAVQPTPADSTDTRTMKDGVPVVELTEDAQTLELFLRSLYPLGSPTFGSVENLLAVFEALRKYMVHPLPSAVELAIAKLVILRPELAYALASRHGLKLLAMSAARRTLERLDDGHVLGIEECDLDFLTGREYHTLLQYQGRCREAAARIARTLDWAERDFLPCVTRMKNPDAKERYYDPYEEETDCNCRRFDIRDDEESEWLPRVGFEYAYHAPDWLRAYMSRCELALLKRPTSEVVYTWDTTRPIWESAVKCKWCKQDIVEDMTKFTTALVAEIEKAVQAVTLD